MAITLDKVIQTEPLPIQILTAGSSVQSSVIGVSGSLVGRVFYDVGIIANATPTPPSLQFEVSQQASGNDTWVKAIQRMGMQLTGTASTIAPDINALDTSFNVGSDIWSSAGYQCTRWLLLYDTVTVSNSEWVNPIAVSGAPTVTVQDPVTNSHLQVNTTIWQAARYTFCFDLWSVKRIRVTVDNSATKTVGPADHVIRVALTTVEAVN
jgi:hypothetical protein